MTSVQFLRLFYRQPIHIPLPKQRLVRRLLVLALLSSSSLFIEGEADKGFHPLLSLTVKQAIHLAKHLFATGRKLVDSAGRSIVIDRGCPASCGDVLVHPGDIVFGDIDGVVVIPRELEKEVISLALGKVEKENLVRNELLKGAILRDAYAKHKIL